MLVLVFVSCRIINMNKYLRYYTLLKTFRSGLFTSPHCYCLHRLERNKILLKLLRILVTTLHLCTTFILNNYSLKKQLSSIYLREISTPQSYYYILVNKYYFEKYVHPKPSCKQKGKRRCYIKAFKRLTLFAI